MLVMSTQLIGFSLGGIMRRFLVLPPSMSESYSILAPTKLILQSFRPTNLVTCALFNTLHAQSYAGIGNRAGITRERFFVYVFSASCAWYFFLGYLFQALSWFTWVCWIAPDNVVVNQLFAYESGLGMSLITFDWAQITYVVNPLATPWWSEANILADFVFFFLDPYPDPLLH
jgi:hypothetical protein